MPPKNEDVISSLMRAAAGSSAKDVKDEELDNYIVEMLTKEAQEKRKKYDEIGTQAYTLETRLKKKPKPNTRFLLNVVKATDSHNQAVIKANDENVARMRRERLDREREASRRSPSPRHRSRSPRRRSRSPRRRSRSPKHKSISSKRRSSRSPSPKRHRHKSSKFHSHSHRSSSPSSKRKHRHRKHRRSRSPSPAKKEEPVQYKGRGKVRINVSSMDKYFSEGYDPLFDTHSDEEKSDMVGPQPI